MWPVTVDKVAGWSIYLQDAACRLVIPGGIVVLAQLHKNYQSGRAASSKKVWKYLNLALVNNTYLSKTAFNNWKSSDAKYTPFQKFWDKAKRKKNNKTKQNKTKTKKCFTDVTDQNFPFWQIFFFLSKFFPKSCKISRLWPISKTFSWRFLKKVKIFSQNFSAKDVNFKKKKTVFLGSFLLPKEKKNTWLTDPT